MNMQALMRQLGVIAVAIAMAGPAFAQRYPERPVRVVVPTLPGGSVDIMGRRVSMLLTPLLGQPFVVENVAGAGNALGTGEVARAKPDGYTLLLGATSGVVISPAVMRKSTYEGVKDFASVNLLGLQYLLIAAGPGMPAQNFKDMIKLLKERPGKFSYATPGVGSVNHLGGELIKAVSGTDMVHVPYKGAAPALNDLMAGRVELSPMTNLSVYSLYKSGKMRILATMSEARLAAFPDVPTTVESGFPEMVMSTFLGLFAPAATPRPIVNQLHAATSKILARPDFQKEFEAMGMIMPPSRTPEETQRYLMDFTARIVPIVKSAGITED